MKTTIAILTTIFLLSCISAIDIQAGESYSFILNEQYSYYEIVGNQTEVDVDVQQNGTEVIIEFGKYINDTFTITFYNWKDEVIESTGQQGGGGSSYTKKKVVVNQTTNETEDVEEIIEEEEKIYNEELTEDEKSKLGMIFLIIFIVLLVIGIIWIIREIRNGN